MKRRLALIHASRAAVDPVTHYYTEHAPDVEITNLLDDGVMRVLGVSGPARPRQRLAEMLRTAREEYGAEAPLLTCSAVTRDVFDELRGAAGYPIVKIDQPMARLAVAAGQRIGVVVSFPPTADTTSALLQEAAIEAGRSIELDLELTAEALQALLGGDLKKHDTLLLAAAGRVVARGVDAIVLAQVSMARLQPVLASRLAVPVYDSLTTSLEEILRIL